MDAMRADLNGLGRVVRDIQVHPSCVCVRARARACKDP